LHGGLRFTFARLAELIRFGLLDLQVRLGGGDLCLGRRSPVIALALASAAAIRILRSASLTRASRSSEADLLADLLIAVKLGDAHGLFRAAIP